MGKIQNEWQDRDYVLRWFGQKQGEAKKTYRSYVKKESIRSVVLSLLGMG